LLTRTTQTSATFSGSFGHSYRFYSVATDVVGNRQPTPTSAQAATQLVAPPVSVPPAVIQFGSAQFAANVDAGSTSILLSRSGNLGSSVTVVLSSLGGQGVVAFQQTIIFGPNVTSQLVPIPIVNDLLLGRSDVIISLILSTPGAGAALGATATASLVIHDDNPSLVTVSSLKTGPVTIGTGKKAKKTTGIVILFSGALNPAPARSLAAFHLLSGKVKKHDTIYSKNVPLSEAIYDPSAHTISLVPKGKLNMAQPEQLKITASLLTDSLGRPIDGNHDGQPGGDFVATLKGKTVTIAATCVARATSVSQRAVEAIDRVLSGNTQLVTRPVRSFPAPRGSHGAAQESQVVKVVLPGSQGFMGRPNLLRRVFTLAHHFPNKTPGALPVQVVRL
jgi:hypothetical protein